MIELGKQLSTQIIDAKCVRFRLVEGGTLILYFNLGNSDTTNKRLWIDCAWRLRKNKQILGGSLDEAALILDVLKQLQGATVKSVFVDADTGDIRLALSTNLFLETFVYSTIDEPWEFRRSDGFRLGIGPKNSPFERFEATDSDQSDNP